MCTSSQIIGSLLVLSVLEIGLGVSSVAVGAVSFSFVLAGSERSTQLGDSSPFLLCGVCGIFCAKKKSGLIAQKESSRKLDMFSSNEMFTVITAIG